jgi:hypothetical protein
MYTIFFHLSGLALIETLFYFLYIGPMETKIFENAISDAFASSKNDASQIENIYILNPFNNSNYITIGENTASNYSTAFKENVDKAESNRIERNNKLFNKALYSWSIIMSVSLVIFLIEMSIKYYLFKKNKILNTQISLNKNNSPKSVDSISDMSIEMVSMSRDQIPLDIKFRGNSFDSNTIEVNNNNNDNIIEIDETNTNENDFFNFNNIRKTILKTTLHYSTLILLIVSFEYWFFNNIILEYDIVSMEELEYVLYENFYPVLSKMVIVTSEDNTN